MVKAPKTATVTLEEPIVRAPDNQVAHLQLRKPVAGELRGLSLAEIATMKADAIVALLPRITTPPITDVEAAGLDAADLFQIGIEVAGFFLPAGMRPDALSQVASIQ